MKDTLYECLLGPTSSGPYERSQALFLQALSMARTGRIATIMALPLITVRMSGLRSRFIPGFPGNCGEAHHVPDARCGRSFAGWRTGRTPLAADARPRQASRAIWGRLPDY